MLDLPRGRELSFEGSPDGVAGAIVGFVYEDVAQGRQIDFSNAPQSVFNTFDGLNITVKVADAGMERWATDFRRRRPTRWSRPKPTRSTRANRAGPTELTR